MKAAFVIFVFLIGFSCSKPEESITPRRALVVESVYSSAIIQPDSLYMAYATVMGLLERNLVEEGDTVNTGTPIIQLINIAPALGMENARLALQQARNDYSGNSALLNSLEKEIRAARLSLFNDSINYIRQQKLWEQKIGSKVEFETRKLAYELSVNNLQLLLNEYERTKNVLSIQVSQALNTYKSSQFTSGEFTVNSKINGVVYTLYKNPGEIVNTVEPLALIGSADKFLIELLVDEMDIVKVAVGQKTLITLDAYGSQVFEATIKKIYPAKDERTQTFKIEAVFLNNPPKLFPGLAGEANIVIAEKQDALIIPRDYLVDENRVLTENGPVTVVTGLRDLNNIEIISGIEENETLYKPEQ